MKACPDCTERTRAGCTTCAGGGLVDDELADAIAVFEKRIRDANPLLAEATCLGCGCTDSRACVGGCSWIVVNRELRQGICSSCADQLSPSGSFQLPDGSSFRVVAREPTSRASSSAAVRPRGMRR